MILIPILIIIIALVLLYYIGTWNHKYFKKLGVPYIKPLPWLGNMLPLITYQMSTTDFIINIYEQFSHQK